MNYLKPIELTRVQRKAYLAAPSQCPICQSSDITGGTVEIDCGRASQEVSCNSCMAEWFDDYTLTGLSDVSVLGEEVSNG